MKKLAKVFALVLTAAMSLSFMASAAFTDEAEIINKDAVNTVSTLGIIAGYTDGSFNGAKTVTRAEMAKMIYVLKMGGKDDGAAYYKSLSFNLSDINGHWAEGYIKYCASLGIIAGKGDGKFYPDEGVTGLQAAKMLLTVQGYDATKAGLVGNTWAMKTAALAADSNYFTNFGVALDEACPRDYAALLIKNALDATYVVWSTDTNAYIKDDTNKDCVSLGEKYFKLHTYEGILVSVGDYGIPFKYGTGSEYTTSAGKGKLAVVVTKKDDASKVALTSSDAKVETFDYSEDISNMVGQHVKVSVTEAGKVYGVFNVEGNTVVETALSAVKLINNNDDKISISDKEYKIEKVASTEKTTNAVIIGEDKATLKNASTNSIHAYLSELGATNRDPARNGSKATFVDYDGNGAFDIVIVTPILKVEKITRVTDSKITAGSGYELDKVTVIGEPAKDKYVAVTDSYFDSDIENVLTVLETLTGKAQAINEGGIKVKFDGEWTAIAAEKCNDVDGAGKFVGDSTYDYCLINGIVYMFDKTAGSATDMAMVIGGKETADNKVDINANIKLLMADGTKVNTGDYTVVSKTTAEGNTTTDLKIGDLVLYSMNDDDEYELQLVAADNSFFEGSKIDTGYDNIKTVTGFSEKDTVVADSGNATFTVADTATVFVKYNEGGDEFKVITGAQLNAFSRDFGQSGLIMYNGTDDAEVVLLIGNTSLPGSAASRTLAFLLEAPTYFKGDKKTELLVWTAEGEQTISMKNDQTGKFNEGDVFAFEMMDDEYASSTVTFLSEALKITKVNGSKITFEGVGTKTADSAVQVINIDTANLMGIDGDSYGAEDNYARAFIEDNKIIFLAVDTENETWDVTKYTADKNAFDGEKDAETEVIDVTYTTTVPATVAEGKTVIVTGNATLTADIAVNGKLTVNGTISTSDNKKITVADGAEIKSESTASVSADDKSLTINGVAVEGNSAAIKINGEDYTSNESGEWAKGTEAPETIA